MGYLPPSVPDSYLQVFRIEPSVFMTKRKVGQVEALQFQRVRSRLTAQTTECMKRVRSRTDQKRRKLSSEWKRNGYIWLEKGQYIDEYC